MLRLIALDREASKKMAKRHALAGSVFVRNNLIFANAQGTFVLSHDV